MAETEKPGAPPGGASAEDLEARWTEAVDALTEHPRDIALLLKAGDISEQLGRRPEAYNYYRKALLIDPSKSFLVGKLRPLAATDEQRQELDKFSRLPKSFQASLGEIFQYPVRGKGLPVLLLGALFLWLARGLIGGGVGVAGFGLAGFIAAYMAMFYIDVCHTTVGGEDHLPEWPDPTMVSDFFTDAGKFFVAQAMAFLPLIAIVALLSLFSSSPPPSAAETAPPPSGVPWREVVVFLAAIPFVPLGLFYLPMAVLANVVLGSPFVCLNAPFIVKSMFASTKDYAICVGLYFGTFFLTGGAELVAAFVGIIPTGFAICFLELYSMTVLMRMMGQFYRMNQAKLGWLGD